MRGISFLRPDVVFIIIIIAITIIRLRYTRRCPAGLFRRKRKTIVITNAGDQKRKPIFHTRLRPIERVSTHVRNVRARNEPILHARVRAYI